MRNSEQEKGPGSPVVFRSVTSACFADPNMPCELTPASQPENAGVHLW